MTAGTDETHGVALTMHMKETPLRVKTLLVLVVCCTLFVGCSSEYAELEENMEAVGLDPDDYSDLSSPVEANADLLCERPINANYLSFVADRPDLDSKLFMVAIAKTYCPADAELVVQQVALADPSAAERIDAAGWLAASSSGSVVGPADESAAQDLDPELAAQGLSIENVLAVTEVADSTGYGYAEGEPMTWLQAQERAKAFINVCVAVSSGPLTWERAERQAISRGVAIIDAEAMLLYLKTHFCRQLD